MQCESEQVLASSHQSPDLNQLHWGVDMAWAWCVLLSSQTHFQQQSGNAVTSSLIVQYKMAGGGGAGLIMSD